MPWQKNNLAYFKTGPSMLKNWEASFSSQTSTIRLSHQPTTLKSSKAFYEDPFFMLGSSSEGSGR